MRVLWLATKPPWPPKDGGRLLLHSTLEGLARRGHEVTLIAPAEGDPRDATDALSGLCTPLFVPRRRRPLVADVLEARLRGRPTTLVRHTHPEIQRVVRDRLARRDFDLIQLEQLHAFGGLGGDPELPVVLRAQNVESDLWAAATDASIWRRRLLRGEVERMRSWEERLLRRCDGVVALTREDAARLEALAPGVGVDVVTAPFPASLPPGPPLDGSPPVVLLAHSSWLPNRLGAEEFLVGSWPEVRRRCPGARLHVFGFDPSSRFGDVTAVTFHPAPLESRTAFPANGVLVVPLAIASGLRMKILEAWARRIPVVGSPAAVKGLVAVAGREVLVARDAVDYARSVERLVRDEAARPALVEAAARCLATVYREDVVVRGLESVWERVLRTGR